MNEPQLDAHLGEANALIAAGDFAKAKALLAETTTIYPEAAGAWKGLGVAENKLGNHEAAERYLLKSLQLDDSDDDAWSILGGLYFYVMARYDDALRCFRRSLSIDSANTYALMNYLTLASTIGEGEAALSEYGPALKDGEGRCVAQINQNVNVPWCYYDLGQILFFEGRYDESQSVIREAFARSSDWQVESARFPYEQLAQTVRFADPAHAVIREFAQYRNWQHTSGE
jgi:tetratricopeptide (TPR) repeat protein